VCKGLRDYPSGGNIDRLKTVERDLSVVKRMLKGKANIQGKAGDRLP